MTGTVENNKKTISVIRANNSQTKKTVSHSESHKHIFCLSNTRTHRHTLAGGPEYQNHPNTPARASQALLLLLTAVPDEDRDVCDVCRDVCKKTGHCRRVAHKLKQQSHTHARANENLTRRARAAAHVSAVRMCVCVLVVDRAHMCERR